MMLNDVLRSYRICPHDYNALRYTSMHVRRGLVRGKCSVVRDPGALLTIHKVPISRRDCFRPRVHVIFLCERFARAKIHLSHKAVELERAHSDSSYCKQKTKKEICRVRSRAHGHARTRAHAHARTRAQRASLSSDRVIRHGACW